VGRTGVLLAMMSLKIKYPSQYSAEQQVFYVVGNLRRSRVGMVQTPEQYKFLVYYEKAILRGEKCHL
jgi:protein tyrosine phosphatase